MRAAAVSSASRSADGERLERAPRLGARHLERGGRFGRPAVEARGVFEQRRVAARAHVVEDRGGGALHALVLRGLEGEQARELRLEARRGGIAAGAG